MFLSSLTSCPQTSVATTMGRVRKALPAGHRTSTSKLTELAALFVALLQLPLFAVAQANSPPEVLTAIATPSEAQPIFAREGRQVRLPCPVAYGKFREWLHNGKSVYGDPSDDRFDPDGRNTFLRISNPRPSSAGRYTCRVANGFGSVILNMTLIVLGPNGTADSSVPPQLGDEAPQFTLTDPAKLETIAGATLRLRCRARGRPQPAVRWFVSGVELAVDDRASLPAASALARGSVVVESGGQQLRLEGVRPADSASYTCLVYNRAGSVNYTYLLTVSEPAQSPRGGPVMLPPANGTFTLGRPAELRCYVESSVAPRFRWLKDTSDAQCDLLETESEAASPETVAGRQYVPVKRQFTSEGGSQQQPPNVHMGRLHIGSVRPEHAGAYLCQAAVGSHVLYNEAHLVVLGADDVVPPGAPVVHIRDGSSSSQPPLPPPAASSPSWPYVFGSQSATLAVIVAVPSLIAILIAIVVIYTFNKRKQERRAFDAKQKRLLLRPDSAPYNQHHPHQPQLFAGVGGAPNEVSASPDMALEDKSSSGSGGGSAALAYRPASAGLLGRSSAAVPLLLPSAAAASAVPPGQRMLLTSAYSCSDGGYHSFVQQQQQLLLQQQPYYVQQLHQQQQQCQPQQRCGSCGSAECNGDCSSSSSSDSESHFSSVSQRRGDRSRRVPQPPSTPPRFAQTPMLPGYEDYMAVLQQSQPRSYCPPPPPPSVY